MKDLLVAVPSRGRPASLERLRDAMEATCRGDTHLLAGVDGEDPCLTAYLGMPGVTFRVLPGGGRGVVACLNAMVMPDLGEYRYIGHFGDDNVPRTEGWDVAITEALERTPFAFGNDLYPREPGSLCCHIFTRAGVVRALGYLGPPCFRHMFVDPVWMEWGKACGITYLHDVILEHLHFTRGLSPQDETYRAAYTSWPQDEAAYHAYLADGLAADIAKIRATL